MRPSTAPERDETPHTPEPLSPDVRIISPTLKGKRRQRLEQAARAGRLTPIAASDALAEESLPRLAAQSLWLLLVSGALYALAIGAARQLQHSGQLLGDGPLAARVGLLLAANILGYVLMIPAHEAMHALVILGLGGRPRFGLRLPLAAYCTAPNQLFLRNGYLAVALAPLVILSVAAVALAWLAPDVAALLLLAVAGNVSGAVGDLAVVNEVRKRPPTTLIADTATGYIAYREGV